MRAGRVARDLLSAAVVTGLTLAPGAADADHAELVEHRAIAAPGGSLDDYLGLSVAVTSTHLVAGAPYDDDAVRGADSGSVLVVDELADGATTQLTAPDGAAGDWFGTAVALEGNRVVVGAPLDDDKGRSSGSVWVFDLAGGAPLKLTAPDGAAGDFFGGSVGLSGDRVVVGAPFDDDGGTSSGSAWVFDLSGGAPVKLTATGAAAMDTFGWDVDIAGARVLVGAPNDDDPVLGSNAGSVWSFDLLAGTGQRRLAPDGGPNEFFGGSVAVDGTRAAAGPLSDYYAGAGIEDVWVFDLAGVAPPVRLQAPDGVEGDDFGVSVAVSGDRVVVGARADDLTGAGADAGAAWSFDLTGVDLPQRLTASGGAAGARFGWSVAAGGGRVAVGAPQHGGVGAAYGFGPPLVRDADGDGVLDPDDHCADTVLPDVAPQLKKHHYETDAEGAFVDARGVALATMTDTGGCSMTQIIDAAGLGAGHRRVGLSQGELQSWISGLG